MLTIKLSGKNTFLFLLLFIITSTVVTFTYLRLYIPGKKSDFAWLAEWRDLCYSNSHSHPENKVSIDYLDILEGNYNGKSYSGYLDNKCSDDSTTSSCQDIPLILSAAFVLRGNEKDFDLAKKTLDHYKHSIGRNIYYDFGELRILSHAGYAQYSDARRIKKYLSAFSQLEPGHSYFEKFYTKHECNEALKRTALIYSRYIDFHSGVYIRTQLIN